MGLIDRMKQQASQLADKAQEAGKAGQAKLEALQARRRADSLLSELGLIAYRSQVGRPQADEDTHAQTLIDQLREYEQEYGSLDDAPAPSSD